jgi:hypothetical protein
MILMNIEEMTLTVLKTPIVKNNEGQRLKWIGHLMRKNLMSPAARAYNKRQR